MNRNHLFYSLNYGGICACKDTKKSYNLKVKNEKLKVGMEAGNGT